MQKKIFFIGFALMMTSTIFLLTSCEKDSDEPISKFDWKKIGLNGLKVGRLELIGNNLYAITNNGLFLKNINSTSGFQSIGLQGKNILDIAVFSPDQILASYRNPSDWEDFNIYETLDGGNTWNVKSTNFGIVGSSETVTDFEWDVIDNTLYATGYGVVAKSLDLGANWEIIWGGWDFIGSGMSVSKNPYKDNDLWFGGQGGIENGFLVNSFNNSIREWQDLVPNPTVMKAIAFDNQSQQNIYVGWEGELSKTNDHGSTWTTLIERHEEAHFFFGIGISQNNSNVVYAGKWIKAAPKQPLEIYYSNNSGMTWNLEKFPNENKGGVLDLKVKSEINKDRIFVALDGGGVYELSPKN